MAGQGETCTCVAAVLFYLEVMTWIQGVEICTQKECGWLIPSYMKNVEYQAVKILILNQLVERKESLMR